MVIDKEKINNLGSRDYLSELLQEWFPGLDKAYITKLLNLLFDNVAPTATEASGESGGSDSSGGAGNSGSSKGSEGSRGSDDSGGGDSSGGNGNDRDSSSNASGGGSTYVPPEPGQPTTGAAEGAATQVPARRRVSPQAISPRIVADEIAASKAETNPSSAVDDERWAKRTIANAEAQKRMNPPPGGAGRARIQPKKPTGRGDIP